MFTTVILKISFFSEFVLLRSLRPQKRIRSLISFCGLAVGVFQKLANYKLNWSLLASWAMKLKLCVSQSNFDLVPNLFSNAKISQVSTHEVGEGLKKQGKPLMNFALFANLHTRLNYDSLDFRNLWTKISAVLNNTLKLKDAFAKLFWVILVILGQPT